MITLWSNKICPVGFATINIRDILVVLQTRQSNANDSQIPHQSAKHFPQEAAHNWICILDSLSWKG